LVSHDRYLIDALATQVWEIFPDQSTLCVFDGTYSEYRAAQDITQEPDPVRIGAQQTKKSPAPGKDRLRRRQKRLEALEARITGLEEQLATTGKQLETPPSDPAKVHQLGKNYVIMQDQLAQLYKEWEMVSQTDLIDAK
jgi:ATP-binding cassette subfamily F protein 3